MAGSGWHDWVQKTFSSRFHRRPARAPRSLRPWLESLEGRAVPATLNLVSGTLTFTPDAGAATTISGITTALNFDSGAGHIITSNAAAQAIGFNTGGQTSGPGNLATVTTIVVVGQGGSLVLNGGSAAETIGVSASQVTRSDGGPITYSGVASLTINGTAQADTITVTGTAAGVATTVNAQGGNDAVTVGNTSNGLGDLAGSLVVNGGGQAGDTLTLNDQKSSSGHTYGVSVAGVTRDGSSVLSFSGFAGLILDASDHADTINIASTASGLATTVNAHGGLDTYGAISQTTIAASGLSINGGGQGETLTLNGGSAGETIGVSNSQVTRSSGGPITYAGLAGLTVNGTAQADSINITGTAAGVATAINGGGGNDAITVANPSNGLGALAGPLTVNGGGQAGDALTLNDQNSSAGHTYGISAAAGVTRDGTSVLNFSGFTGLTLDATTLADTINITGTAAGLATTVNAGGGNDAVTVGNLLSGLGALAGPLTVGGGGQSGDALTLNDQNSSSGHTYGVSAAGVTRDGTSVLNFSGFAGLILDASDHADTINIASTASGLATTVNAHGGLDTFGAIVQTTIAAAGLSINGGGQGEALTLGSTGAGPEIIAVTTTQVTRSAGGAVSYSGLVGLVVNGSNNGTGDTFNVTPSAAVAITINGRAPTTAPGDTLNYSGSAGQINAVDTSNGTITEAGLQPITYEDIETLTGNSSLVVVIDAGAQANDGITDNFLISGSGSAFQAFVNGTLAYTNQTAFFNSIIVNGSGDADNLTVDASAGNAIPQFGIAFHAGIQTNALTVNSGSAAETIGVSATQVTLHSGGPISYSGVANLTVNGTALADTINITGTGVGVATTVNAGGGIDAVSLGNLSNGLGALAGSLSVTGGGQAGDTLTLNDQKSSSGHTYGVGTAGVTRDGASVLTFGGFAGLVLDASDLADTINVTGTASGLATTVNADGGLDTFGAIDQTKIAAAGLSINGGGQGESLTLNGGTVGETIGVSGTQVTRTDGGAVAYSGLATLTVNGTAQADTITVSGTPAGTAMTVNAGGGLDTLAAIGQTAVAAAGLVINGGGQGESLTLNGGSAAETIGVSGTQVTRSDGGPISYSGLASLTVNGTDSATGDRFDVTPSATLPITIDGKAPTSVPGDSLTYSGVTGQINAIDASHGTITAAGFLAVTYRGIEKLTTSRPPLSVSGAPTGTVELFSVNSAGTYTATPAASVAPFGAIPVDLRTVTGDVNGDGSADTIVVTGPGTPIRVAVVSGVDNSTILVAPFDPFGGDFTGGGFIAAADLDGDHRAEFVVTPDQGGGPRVSIFSLINGAATAKGNFLGIDDSNFRGGCRATLGDVNHDGTPDVAVSAGFLGGPRTALFDGKTVLATPTRLVGDFFAFPGSDATTLRNGVFVAAGDVNGDGFADLIFGGGPGGAPRVFVLSGALISANNVSGAQAAPIANFFVAGNSADRGGVRLAVKDADGDGRSDVVAGSGEGSKANARIYLGKNFTGTGEPGIFQDLSIFGGGALPGGVFVG